MTTTKDLLLQKSTISSGTALEHLLSSLPSGEGYILADSIELELMADNIEIEVPTDSEIELELDTDTDISLEILDDTIELELD